MSGILGHPLKHSSHVRFRLDITHPGHRYRFAGTMVSAEPATDTPTFLEKNKIIGQVRLVWPVAPSSIHRANFHTDAAERTFCFINLGQEVRLHGLIGLTPARSSPGIAT